MKPPGTSGLTWIEALIALAVVAVLIALALPALTKRGGGNTMMLSNMRQLHLATQTMVLDGDTTGDTNLVWPGDAGGSFSRWAQTLVPAYLSSNDFRKLLSGPGKIVRSNQIPSMENSAVLVYAVSSNSPANTVFLTSANFTNSPGLHPPLNPTAKPYGDAGFVVFRKDGDGAILLKRQVNATNLIGSFAPLCH